ncbi:hypothetical protein [Marinobacter alkaliphilus]|uniref:Uncharacterized protein n=1 Tax=Marinobacter alkaliphilus TaxID=254719 RepID=A0ABZ3E8X6_9GAMM
MMTNKPKVTPHVADGVEVATVKVFWPESMPENRIEFGLLCADHHNPYLSILRWGSMRPEVIDSHYVQKPVVQHFERYSEVTIEEADSRGGKRSYAVELKHA